MIDVLIQTFNEELNLPTTLASVSGWAKRVFVVDSGSTDRTREIAESAGATVVQHAWEGYARQKNWAIDHLPFESPWILIIDADEAVSAELRDELLALVARSDESIRESGFWVNRIFRFLGRDIRHCGYFPSWNLRLFRRGRARYEDRIVHEHMIVNGPTGYLKGLLVHEDQRGLEHFFAKHNRYSTLEATELIERPEPWPAGGWRTLLKSRNARKRFAKGRVMPLLPVPWLWRFLYMYVGRAGFLDGRAGWHLCWAIGGYEMQVQIKYRELRRLQKLDRLPAKSVGGLSSPEGFPTESREPAPTPTLVYRRGGEDSVPEFTSPWSFKENVARAAWMVASALLFRPSFHNWYAWRRFLLRLFGAKVGRGARVRPSVRIEIPWNLELGDGAIVGDDAILYSLGRIAIGRRAVISQYTHLCAGTHDHRRSDFPLLRPPIEVGDDAWLAADVFVGPGVTIGPRTVVGARSNVFADLPGDVVAFGSPARAVRPRDPIEPPDRAALASSENGMLAG